MTAATGHLDDKATSNGLVGACDRLTTTRVLATLGDKLQKLRHIYYNSVTTNHVQIGGSNLVDVGSCIYYAKKTSEFCINTF